MVLWLLENPNTLIYRYIRYMYILDWKGARSSICSFSLTANPGFPGLKNKFLFWHQSSMIMIMINESLILLEWWWMVVAWQWWITAVVMLITVDQSVNTLIVWKWRQLTIVTTKSWYWPWVGTVDKLVKDFYPQVPSYGPSNWNWRWIWWNPYSNHS